ncbi:MAG: DUF2085 domain-containing protein [Anaerolineales bacterium]|nr:DUF2085 domain-containing protein [Anaerolineales bacterium]MCB8991674.1 DUF2085 domain-containing protein [Ardenticatenaceae bacterium]MCB9005562.1 DUF2085 domain-containing protein [Ardenticatenaceae bacterium]
MSTPPTKQPITGWQRDLVIRIDKGVYWFSKHWLAVFNFVLALYVGLPVLAPVLMNAGAASPANIIYAMYKPMCHQMATRSFFLFGEQYAYPRNIAPTDLQPIEAYTPTLPEYAGVDPNNWVDYYLLAGREFRGNAQMGYKMALCERDMSMYSFLLVGGLLYAMLRKRIRIRPLPFLLFILIGLGPIALDGFSQLFGYYATPIDGSTATGFLAQMQRIFPLRESTPMLRSATGALFGFMLAWLAYPQIDGGMKATEHDLHAKLSRIGEL